MTVSRFAAVVFLPLLWTPDLCGTAGGQAATILTVPEGPGQPSFTIRVLTTERQGVAEVSGPAGTRPQTLTCALEPYSSLAGGFALEDLDMDGHPDLRVVREFGAKWKRYCIWLYQPSTHSFEKDGLASQMELVSNLTVDPGHHRLVGFSIGPVRPSWDVYRIVSGADPQERVLLPEQSCVIETDETGNAAATVARFGNGRVQTGRRALPRGDRRTTQQICDGFGGAGG